MVTEPTKRGPGRPRKNVEYSEGAMVPSAEQAKPEPAPIPPGPLVLEVRLGPPGQGKIVFSQRVYKMLPPDQNSDRVIITGALHPTINT